MMCHWNLTSTTECWFIYQTCVFLEFCIEHSKLFCCCCSHKALQGNSTTNCCITQDMHWPQAPLRQQSTILGFGCSSNKSAQAWSALKLQWGNAGKCYNLMGKSQRPWTATWEKWRMFFWDNHSIFTLFKVSQSLLAFFVPYLHWSLKILVLWKEFLDKRYLDKLFLKNLLA